MSRAGWRTGGGRAGRSAVRPAGRMIRRIAGRASLAVGLVLGALALTAAPASASDPEDRITAMDVLIDLAPDGVAHVSVDLTVDFGTSPNHGPYLTWITREAFDDERDREYRISRVTATSATAPAAVQTQDETAYSGGRSVTVRAFLIGDEDVTVTGQHSYTVTFDVEGWVNAADYAWPADDAARTQARDAGRKAAADREVDELYLDVVAAWEIPVSDVSIQVTGPADVVDVACYDTPGQPDPCDGASANGAMASFTQAALGTGQPLTIAVAYPRGTFAGVEPLLSYPWSAARAFALTPWTVLGGLGVGGVGAFAMLRRLRRTGWDEQFLGLTPGVLPAPGQEVQVGARRRAPVAVQFTPPEGFRAGQLGTLVDSTADPHDVTATIIDLAVRGHLRITQVDEGTDWLLERATHPTDNLLPYEATLLGQLFRQRSSVQLDDLKETFSESMGLVQAQLYTDVTERGWFRRDPSTARSAWAARGVGVLVLGIAATVALAMYTQWAVVGLGLVLVGIVWLLATSAAPARTAAGTAVLAQAEGFRLYLATAEADQLRFEEGEDLFSRYLPFAVAFGLTERWARLFEQLAAQGRQLTEPSWYVAYGNLPFWAMAGSLGRDLSSFTSSMDTALTSVPPSSSGTGGGSGFSGGFGGGGVSGGGGGTW